VTCKRGAGELHSTYFACGVLVQLHMVRLGMQAQRYGLEIAVRVRQLRERAGNGT